MGKKISWSEAFTTITRYSAELTDEQYELYQTNEEEFFDEVFYNLDRDLEWDKIKNEETFEFEIEDDELEE